MEDFSTIIFLLFAIAIPVIKAIGKKFGDADEAPLPPFVEVTDEIAEAVDEVEITVSKPRIVRSSRKKVVSPQPSAPSVSSSSSSVPDEPQPDDFSIRSAEEARRAIVWSEILNRKYS